MNWNNILVIAPHPDDEVLGCGGTIARLVAEGRQVQVCIVTKAATELFSPELIERGRSEARVVHKKLGVARTHFLDFPAPLLDTVAQHRISDALRSLIAQNAIDTVFVPHGGDIHLDHTITFQTTLVACRPINDSPVCRIYAYETLSETEWSPPRGDTWFIPTMFVDISQFVPDKLAAMEGYASQIKSAPHPRSVDGIQALAKVRGYSVGCDAAEAFALIREIRR
jgi:LmbE family N-acetylglucosaminyl deacetylase